MREFNLISTIKRAPQRSQAFEDESSGYCEGVCVCVGWVCWGKEMSLHAFLEQSFFFSVSQEVRVFLRPVGTSRVRLPSSRPNWKLLWEKSLEGTRLEN